MLKENCSVVGCARYGDYTAVYLGCVTWSLYLRRLSFCDLAGAERSSKTQTTGERMKEAGNINTSLLALSRCMTNLRFNQTNKYVL